MTTFAGLYVPLLTPLRADGAVDPDVVAGHVDRLLAGGVDGLVALGTTGEFADLTPDERDSVVEATVAAADGRVPVIAGVGGIGTAEACAHARRAEDAGADGVLCLPPLYWKLGDDALPRHFAAVTEATSLPLILYDFPALSGTPLSPALVERAARELPRVAGIKQSGAELRVTHAVLTRVKPHRPDFAVLTGAADLVLPGLLAGTDGTIAAIANVDPTPLAEMLAAHRRGDLEAAAEAHRRVLALLAIPVLSSPPILALKAAARAYGSPLEPVVRTVPAGPDGVVARASALADRLRAPAPG
jgi:4-hydroxy-tetrahydrodipicolinate synthase